uniref:Uncharacterized protein n=1 Tax=Ixodes ricinus TaxID=34613 RepID=A0A6B0UL54_IXORI
MRRSASRCSSLLMVGGTPSASHLPWAISRVKQWSATSSRKAGFMWGEFFRLYVHSGCSLIQGVSLATWFSTTSVRVSTFHSLHMVSTILATSFMERSLTPRLKSGLSLRWSRMQ